VYRRAWVLMVVLAAGMAAWAIIEAIVLDKRWSTPRAASSARRTSGCRSAPRRPAARPAPADHLELWRSPARSRDRRAPAAHPLDQERITLVALGISCFYVVYVTYRNIKSFLPFVIETKYDRELHLLDHALLFGHDPANDAAHGARHRHRRARAVLRLPVVPADGAAGRHRVVVWVRNLSYGYWFVTSQCLAWSLGTISYYALPTLGPGFRYVQLYTDLPNTPSKQADGLPRLHPRLRPCPGR
jgi:hypothetical protein